jgi:hypothetical protein
MAKRGRPRKIANASKRGAKKTMRQSKRRKGAF